MTHTLQSVIFIPTSKVNNKRVVVVVCDSAIDSVWVVPTEGTTAGGDGTPVQASYATVDNLVNSTSCTVKYGPLQWLVAPFTRRTFQLPDLTQTVEIDIASGVVTLTLAEANMAIPDEVNQLATGGGGGGVGEYNPHFQYTGGITPVADNPLMVHKFEEAVQFQNNFNGFQGGVSPVGGVNPAANYVCPIYKNAVHIGDLTYHTDGTCAATTVGGVSVNFAVSDFMVINGAHVP